MREKSAHEVQIHLSEGKCGIFSLNQLPQQQSGNFWYRFRFKTLAIISILGFAVSPMPIKANNFDTSTSTQNIHADEEKPESKRQKKKAARKTRRHLNKTMAGF